MFPLPVPLPMSSSASGRGPIFLSTEARVLSLEGFVASNTNALQTNADKLQTFTDSFTAHKSETDTKIEKMNETINGIMSKYHYESYYLRSINAQQDEKITQLQQQVSTQQQEIVALQTREATITRAIQELIRLTGNNDTQIQCLTPQVSANTSNIAFTTEQMQDTITSIFIVSKHASKLEEKQRACEEWAAKSEAVLRSNIGATSTQVYDSMYTRAVNEIPHIINRIEKNSRGLLTAMVPQLQNEFNITDVIDESANRLKSKWFPAKIQQHNPPFTTAAAAAAALPESPLNGKSAAERHSKAAERAAKLQSRAEEEEVQYIRVKAQQRNAPIALAKDEEQMQVLMSAASRTTASTTTTAAAASAEERIPLLERISLLR